MDELRDGIVHIHRELHELRKLVKRCMKKQDELHDSIKKDIFDAIRQSCECYLFHTLMRDHFCIEICHLIL